MPKQLINIIDLTQDDIDQIFQNIDFLYESNEKILNNRTIGLIFEKYSTRTRISFQVGIHQLGGKALDIKFEDLNLQRIETFEDTFEMLSCYIDALVYRTNDHNKILNGMKYFQKPIINALSDISHPCQAIADIYTIKEHFKILENINIAWFGDLNNVLLSLYECISFFPKINLIIFTDKYIHSSKPQFVKKDNVKILYDINATELKNINCVMTDVYNSMNDTTDKENLLKPFQVNSKIMEKVDQNAIFMHCLPAKIGSEVTKDVIKGKQSIVIKQAENRLHAQKGILKWLNL